MISPVFIKNLNEIIGINPYKFIYLDDDTVLLTSYTGNYVYLTKEEFKKFRIFDLDKELYDKLVNAGIIITRKNFKRLVRNLSIKTVLSKLCRFFVYSITRRCNQACLYCYAGSPEIKNNVKKFDMDEDIAKQMLEFIGSIPYRAGDKIILVTEGGEPLLKFDLIQFIYNEKKKIEQEKKVKIRMGIVTNLTLMDEDIAKTFMEWVKNKDFSFCSSLEGPKELHDKLRPFKNGKGTYETVTYWVEYFKKEYNYTVPLMSTVTKYHVEMCTPRELLEEYYKWNQSHYFFKIFNLCGTGLKKFHELSCSPEILSDYWIKMIEETIKMYKEGKPISERRTNIFVANIESPRRSSLCERKPCGAGLNMIAFDESGNILPCDTLRSLAHRHTIGKLKTNDYYYVLNKSLGMWFSKMIEDVNIICQNCVFSPYCNICLSDTYGLFKNTWHIESKKYCLPYYKVFKYLFLLKYKYPQKYKILVEYAKKYNKKISTAPCY